MTKIEAYFKAEGRAEKARKRCIGAKKSKQLDRSLRQWFKAELECAALKGSKPVMPVKRALKKYHKRGKLLNLSVDLYLLRHELIWTH